MKELTDTPCPKCLPLAGFGHIRAETVQRVPVGALAPLDIETKQPVCFDCASAGTLLRAGILPDFVMARVAVGNDRQEQYRLPGLQAGLVKAGFMRPSKPGDVEDQIKWLEENNWFEMKEQEEDT